VIRIGISVAIVALAAALLSAPHAGGQDADVVKRVGKRMMCLCGCNQVLVECNHVGCPMSAEMIGKLKQRVARNESDDLILQAFVQEYGQRVMAEPPATGFNLAAWLMPLFALVVGSVIVMVTLLRMSRPRPAPAATGTDAPIFVEPDSAANAVSPEALRRLRQQADRESEE